MIGVDGDCSDALLAARTPHLGALVDRGISTFTAFAGRGIDEDDPTQALVVFAPR